MGRAARRKAAQPRLEHIKRVGDPLPKRTSHNTEVLHPDSAGESLGNDGDAHWDQTEAFENMCTNPNCTELDCIYCSVTLKALTDACRVSPIRPSKRLKPNDSNTAETNTVCEIQAPTRSLTRSSSGMGEDDTDDHDTLSHAEFSLSHAEATHAELHSEATDIHSQSWSKVECAHLARTRSQSVQADRGHNVHLHQPDNAEL